MILCAKGEFQIRVKEIAGCSNRIPDYMSRSQERQKYRELFQSSVANEFGTLTEYFVRKSFFVFLTTGKLPVVTGV